jgi:DNA primase catalytic core
MAGKSNKKCYGFMIDASRRCTKRASTTANKATTIYATVAPSRVQVGKPGSGGKTTVEGSVPPAATETETSMSPFVAPLSTASGGGGGGDLQNLKAAVDIVSVIESYGLPKFRRSGTGAVCCCPFHDDTNPSMSIDATRQMYKCFSCGAGGDVLKFVQEYSKLPGQEELSFGQVIHFLDNKFGDGTFTMNDGAYKSKVPSEQREKERARQERCLQANAAAASFFADTLTQVSSGAARLYLRSRGVVPTTIRVFGIGYAGSNRNGIVGHLMGLNFTAAEVVDAGLAIVRNKEERQSNATRDDLDFSDIMDKFNNRLMVPIMDETGKKVLGFGGRVIISEKEKEVVQSASNFKPPKYLNSPETPVFAKSNILFGIFVAKKSIEATATLSSKRPTIVLVEGYMDAISLWGAGYHTVAATMGTAVSQNQLDSAAKAVAGMGGRIVLCLDNDKAGIAATERLCGNGMLAKVSSKYKVDVLIASLPSRIKDPGDYAERHRGDNSFAEKFEREVIGTASDWINWYISSLIKQYDRNAPRGTLNSFGNIFARVGEFIGATLDAADRTRAALDVSHLLSELMKIDRNTTEISKSVQIQLEADLIDVAARHSYSRNALSRRVEEASSSSKDSKMILSNLMRGDLSAETSPTGNTPSLTRTSGQTIPARPFVRSKKENRPRRITTMQRTKTIEKSLTPFFAGFDFAHKTDAEWLGTTTNALASKV